MSDSPEALQRQSLREQVDSMLPSWQSWYPSLFDAAQDLGLIRARVCAPSSLMLSNRHAQVQSEAVQAFKEQWCVEDEPEMPEHASLLKRIQNAARHGQTGLKQRHVAPNQGRGNKNFRRR
jgi:hypothetical protein